MRMSLKRGVAAGSRGPVLVRARGGNDAAAEAVPSETRGPSACLTRAAGGPHGAARPGGTGPCNLPETRGGDPRVHLQPEAGPPSRRDGKGDADGDKKKADWQYRDAVRGHGKASECIQCGQCESACPQHLPIISYLEESAENLE